MKNILSSFIKEFIKVVIIVAVAVPTIALFAAWTGPTGAPPTNNADAPVNVSNNPQEKKGDLSIHRTEGGFDVGMFAADKLKILGGAIFNNNSPTDDKKVIINTGGNVGIGTMSPTEKLEVEGGIKISDTINTNEGTIRWTGADFEGYTGTQWKSLTSSGVAGCPSPAESFVFGTIIYCLTPGTELYVLVYNQGNISFSEILGDGWVIYDGNGNFRIRARVKHNASPGGPLTLICDSGIVNGRSAQCSSGAARRARVSISSNQGTRMFYDPSGNPYSVTSEEGIGLRVIVEVNSAVGEVFELFPGPGQ